MGNGCLGDEVGTCSPQGARISVEFLYGHGAMSQTTYQQLHAQCPDFANPNAVCQQWLDKMSDEVGPYYGYNLYDDCGPNGQEGRHEHLTWREHQAALAARHPTAAPSERRSLQGHHQQHTPKPNGGFGYPCGKQHGATSWLNSPAVREALHVKSAAFYGYSFCKPHACPAASAAANPVSIVRPDLDQIMPPFNYTSNVATLVPTYHRLIPRIKVLVYNGDIDPCVPYNGNE